MGYKFDGPTEVIVKAPNDDRYFSDFKSVFAACRGLGNLEIWECESGKTLRAEFKTNVWTPHVVVDVQRAGFAAKDGFPMTNTVRVDLKKRNGRPWGI